MNKFAAGIARPGAEAASTPPRDAAGVDPVEPPPPPVAPGSRQTPILVHGHELAPGQRFISRNRLSGRLVTLTYRGGGLHHSTAGDYILATARNSNARCVLVSTITRVVKAAT